LPAEIAVQLDSVSKRWGDTLAVDNVSFTTDAGQFLVMLGPSGCGKSTTLRMIAGLEAASAGHIALFGREVTELPPAARHLSMVFQSYALFPHLNVAENIVFGLKVRRTPKAERRDRLQRVAKLTGLEDLLHRKPAQLSGGQRQRVALARAIVAEHPLCLMDEPLSNLDAKLRQEMRNEIRALQQKLGMTVLYVTHDQVEAMSMADQILLLDRGRIDQQGSPDQLYDAPASLFAAGFIGNPPMNLLALRPHERGWCLPDGPLLPDLQLPAAVLGIRPERLWPVPPGRGLLGGRVAAGEYLGADTILTLRVAGHPVAARQPGHYRTTAGERLDLLWDVEDTHVFAAEDGRRRDDWRPNVVGALHRFNPALIPLQGVATR
jgi:sn-glycerol 3-phosphate transport system ATP-binding protein